VGSGKWQLVFNSLTLPIAAGSTPQIIIQASYTNYTVQTFSFNLALLTVPSTLTVYQILGGSNYILITNSITVNWSENVQFTSGIMTR
jgi:hypothetical protein